MGVGLNYCTSVTLSTRTVQGWQEEKSEIWESNPWPPPVASRGKPLSHAGACVNHHRISLINLLSIVPYFLLVSYCFASTIPLNCGVPCHSRVQGAVFPSYCPIPGCLRPYLVCLQVISILVLIITGWSSTESFYWVILLGHSEPSLRRSQVADMSHVCCHYWVILLGRGASRS